MKNVAVQMSLEIALSFLLVQYLKLKMHQLSKVGGENGIKTSNKRKTR
jgi:hypothetical protein